MHLRIDIDCEIDPIGRHLTTAEIEHVVTQWISQYGIIVDNTDDWHILLNSFEVSADIPEVGATYLGKDGRHIKVMDNSIIGYSKTYKEKWDGEDFTTKEEFWELIL